MVNTFARRMVPGKYLTGNKEYEDNYLGSIGVTSSYIHFIINGTSNNIGNWTLLFSLEFLGERMKVSNITRRHSFLNNILF